MSRVREPVRDVAVTTERRACAAGRLPRPVCYSRHRITPFSLSHRRLRQVGQERAGPGPQLVACSPGVLCAHSGCVFGATVDSVWSTLQEANQEQFSELLTFNGADSGLRPEVLIPAD